MMTTGTSGLDQEKGDQDTNLDVRLKIEDVLKIGARKEDVDTLLRQSSSEEQKEIAMSIIYRINSLPQRSIVFLEAPLKYMLYRIFLNNTDLIKAIGSSELKQKLERRDGRILPSDIIQSFTPNDFEIPDSDVGMAPDQLVEGLPKILIIGAYEPGELPIGRYNAPPFGLVRMASFLRNSGTQADIYDVTKNGVVGLEKTLRSTHYDYVGFSVLGSTILHDLSLIHKVKKVSPKSKILAGGQSATFRPDLMEEAPVDNVCVGYGEYPILNLIYQDGQSQDQSNIPGLLCRKEQGQFDITSAAERTGDKDLTIFSTTYRSDFVPLEAYYEDNRRYYATENNIETVRIFTQTNCPHTCNFCSSRNFLAFAEGKTRKKREPSEAPIPEGNRSEFIRAYVKDRTLSCVRNGTSELSPESFVNLILRAIKPYPGVKVVFINDDNFLSKRMKKRFMKIVEIIKETPELKDMKFICSTRVDDVDDETIAFAKEMGIKEINFGVESFSENGLKSLSKRVRKPKDKTAVDVTRRALDLCFKYGIGSSINLISFYPEITLDQLEVTISNSLDCKKAYGDKIKFNLATFIRAYFGATIVEEDYPEEERIKVSETEVGRKIYEAESRIYPKNEQMRELARLSTEIKSSLEEESKRDHHWQSPRAPKEAIPLYLFKSIYLAAEQLGLVEHGHYQGQIAEMDEMIEVVFQKAKRSPIGVDFSFENGEKAEFFEGESIVTSSIDKKQITKLMTSLNKVEVKGLLRKEYARTISQVVNFQKDLFNEQWDSLGEFRQYFELLFHNYECTRYWHLEPIQKDLAMVFFLIVKNIDISNPEIVQILNIFGFDFEVTKKRLVPYLEFYLRQESINIGKDPTPKNNMSQEQLRDIFTKALEFLK